MDIRCILKGKISELLKSRMSDYQSVQGGKYELIWVSLCRHMKLDCRYGRVLVPFMLIKELV